MYKKIKFFLSTGPLIFFVFLVNGYYFSDSNRKKTNISRTTYSLNQITKSEDLPLLKNDTDNVITYKEDVEEYIKNKKNYTFWELLKKEDDK
tara:strand:+ start:537 stop:812 length:276 start_codon:yes stop_codon:yes gene_type:complete